MLTQEKGNPMGFDGGGGFAVYYTYVDYCSDFSKVYCARYDAGVGKRLIKRGEFK